jgi:hypothetical protein
MSSIRKKYIIERKGLGVDKDADIIIIFYSHPVDFLPLLLVKPNEERSLNIFTRFEI